MALKKTESILLEAISGYMKERTLLGLDKTEPTEVSHTSQFRWESLKDEFALKIADSKFFESITSAFNAVHSYKYIDHPTFCIAFTAELKSRAVPADEIDKACKAVESLVNGLTADKPSERDAGWNPNLAEIAKMTRKADNHPMERPTPFTGGGPWAESHIKYASLLISEGVIPNDDKDAKTLAMHFLTLKNSPYLKARAKLAALATEAHDRGYHNLKNKIIEHIEYSDANEAEKIFDIEDPK